MDNEICIDRNESGKTRQKNDPGTSKFINHNLTDRIVVANYGSIVLCTFAG